MTLRRSRSNELKAKVVLEAIKNEKTLSEIASIYEVHPNLVAKWKKQLLQNASVLFNDGAKNKKKGEELEQEELFKHIGRLKVENDFLKKSTISYSNNGI